VCDAGSGLGLTPTERGFDHFFGFLGGDIDYFTHTRDGRADWWEGDRPAPTFATLPDGRLNETEYATSRFEEESIRWLSEAQRRAGKPFLQLLAFNAPHSPMQALTKDLSAPECRHLSHGRAVRPRAKGSPQSLPPGVRARIYCAQILAVDRAIDRVRKALDELQLANHTILVCSRSDGLDMLADILVCTLTTILVRCMNIDCDLYSSSTRERASSTCCTD